MTIRRFFWSLAAGAAVAVATSCTPFQAWWWLTGGVVFVVGLTGQLPDLT
ncbi:hypothetical protein ACFV4X_26300 [Streptomyces ardesiacus]